MISNTDCICLTDFASLYMYIQRIMTILYCMRCAHSMHKVCHVCGIQGFLLVMVHGMIGRLQGVQIMWFGMCEQGLKCDTRQLLDNVRVSLIDNFNFTCYVLPYSGKLWWEFKFGDLANFGQNTNIKAHQYSILFAVSMNHNAIYCQN